MDLPSFFKRVINTGYDGVEIAVPFDKKFEVELRTLLDKTGLKLIGQQHLSPKMNRWMNILNDWKIF